MNSKNQGILVLVWFLVSGVMSGVFIGLVESFNSYGRYVELFAEAYEVSPVLAVVLVFVFWGVMISVGVMKS